MYRFERLKVENLTKNERKAYKELLAPPYESSHFPLGLLDPHVSQIAVAALAQGKPVGLLVAKRVEESVWNIFSLHVDSAHENKRLEEHLIEALEKELQKIDASALLIDYKLSDAPKMDPFLNKLHWNGKRSIGLLCEFEDVSSFHPPWFEQAYPLPAGFEIFPWKDLTPPEKARILERQQKKLIPQDFHPFAGSGTFEPRTSLGLRYQGEVVGWAITRLLNPQLLDYFCIYVDYSFQARGIGMFLLQQVIKNQQNTNIKTAQFFVNFLHVPMLWIRTVHKRLAPFATKMTLFQQGWKKLN